MFARLARYEIDPERAEEAVESFQEATKELADIPGQKGGYVLIDQEGSIATLTFWDSRVAMETGASQAGRLRQQAVRAVGGSVLSVNEYEVAFEIQ